MTQVWLARTLLDLWVRNSSILSFALHENMCCAVVHTADDVFTLELYMALATLVLAVLAVFFPAAPPTPPTRSSHVKEAGNHADALQGGS